MNARKEIAMPADAARAKDIFLAASELPQGERAAFLDRACAGDAELRRRVGALLAAHDDAGSFLDRPAEGPTGAIETSRRSVAVSEEAGTRLGAYKLLQPLGE